MTKDIEPKLKPIEDYLKLDKTKNFVIPEYQRSYSWDINQCDKLWQDIEAFVEMDAKDPYFFGTIIVDCSSENDFSLIDGQQRTTTFILLMKAILMNLMLRLENFGEDPQGESERLKEGLIGKRNRIMRILYKIDDEERVDIFKDWSLVKEKSILINNSINEQYKDETKKILDSLDYDSAEKAVTRIKHKQKDNKYTNHFRNFKFFFEKLKSKGESQLNAFAKIFLDKCQIIEIRSWQVEQAITMFNSLNSTGLPLSDADIISAQLYSKSNDQSNNNDQWNFNDHWENISKLANDLNDQKIASIDSILQQFMYINRAVNKEYLSKESESVNVTTPGLRRYYTDIKKELLNDPEELCKNLSQVIDNWNKVRDYPIVKLLLKFNENIRIYFSSFMYRIDNNDLSEKIITEITECLLRLFSILELVDSGYSSTKFKSFLFKINIDLVDKNIPISDVKKAFDNHININWKKEDIENSIKAYDKSILVYLNEYLYSKSKNKEFYLNDDANIEHIMPSSGRNIEAIRKDAHIETKDAFKSTVNKLGNKILLEENINKSLGHDWFGTKKTKTVNEKLGYKDSKYIIANKLTNYKKNLWEKDDIEKATEKNSVRIVNFIFDT